MTEKTLDDYKAQYEQCILICRAMLVLVGQLAALDEGSYEHNLEFGLDEALNKYEAALEAVERERQSAIT